MRLFRYGSAAAMLVTTLSSIQVVTGCSGGASADSIGNEPPLGSGAKTGAGGRNQIAIPGSAGATSGGAPNPSANTGGASSAPVGKAGSSAGGSGTPTGGQACSAETRVGRRTPLDMYFLVDSSGSMADDVEGGTKWELVVSALVDFLKSPRNTDLGVGIGYFPNTAPTDCSRPGAVCVCSPFSWTCFPSEGGSCSAEDYETPAVGLALPSRAQAVIADLESHGVDGSTPTRPALEGALKYVQEWGTLHPERKTVVVLATDGEPTECDANTPEDVASIAARALASHAAIQTFVIGVGDSLASLDVVAHAGGTERAFLVDPRANLASEFAEALEKIRGAAASCEFTIPTAGNAGEKIDPSKVNVRLTVNGVPTRLSQTFGSDPKNCGSNGGWYYDNPAAPTRIRLCESTCQALNGGSIDVEFGCDTMVQPPR